MPLTVLLRAGGLSRQTLGQGLGFRQKRLYIQQKGSCNGRTKKLTHKKRAEGAAREAQKTMDGNCAKGTWYDVRKAISQRHAALHGSITSYCVWVSVRFVLNYQGHVDVSAGDGARTNGVPAVICHAPYGVTSCPVVLLRCVGGIVLCCGGLRCVVWGCVVLLCVVLCSVVLCRAL